MLQGTRSLLAISLTFFAAQARKDAMPEDTRKVHVPQVGDECDKLCVFEQEVDVTGRTNSWCFKSAPPVFRIGWKWQQEFDTKAAEVVGAYTRPAMKYWRVEFLPYLELQAFIQSLLNIERLLYWETTGDIPLFNFSVWGSVITNGEFSVCPGFGYENDLIEFIWTMSLKFTDCYKNILVDLCDFASTWTGYDAKILDECDLSNDSTIKLVQLHLFDATIDYTLYGTAYPTSLKYCWPLPGLSTKPACQTGLNMGSLCGAPDAQYNGLVDSFAKNAYTKIGNYFWDNYKDTGITFV